MWAWYIEFCQCWNTEGRNQWSIVLLIVLELRYACLGNMISKREKTFIFQLSVAIVPQYCVLCWLCVGHRCTMVNTVQKVLWAECLCSEIRILKPNLQCHGIRRGLDHVAKTSWMRFVPLFKGHQSALFHLLLFEDTVKKLSMNQEMGSNQSPYLPAARSWTSQFPELWEIHTDIVYKPLSL